MTRTILFGGALVALLASAAGAQNRDGSWWGGLSLPSREPDAAYTLSTKGKDTRVYEWTPETAPEMTCIVQYADAGPAGMQCFPKAQEGA